MQNNVTELTQRLLRSLDSNYNVTNMPAVIEIISQLEKVAITKELLEATRLGKYINELRRKTANESLSKRSKELLKKWRNTVLPESNGQIKKSPPGHQAAAAQNLILQPNEEASYQVLKAKKRLAIERPMENLNTKRAKVNGGMTELDFSDNSNSSFKDVIASIKTEPKRDVIITVNSDSNSSVPEKHDPQLDQQTPKKRGRKKGSKNHKNLIDEAESSFTSKLAVSRGNSKVKTTQELIASLQSKNSNSAINSLLVRPKEDLMEKAAKLTERVSIIDQQLNTNASRSKNAQRNKFKLERNERVIESGSVINDKSLLNRTAPPKIKPEDDDDDDVEIVEVVEDDDDEAVTIKKENQETEQINIITSLSIEEALKQLPPIDKSALLDDDEQAGVKCSCILQQDKSEDFSIEPPDSESDPAPKIQFVQDQNCQADRHLRQKYHLDEATESQLDKLHSSRLPNVNGNWCLGPPKDCTLLQDNGLYVNVVPNVNVESIPKDVKDFSGENFDRYSFSESEPGVKCEQVGERTGDEKEVRSFREWHEVIELPSYNGEVLKILPYVIID